MGLLRLLLAIAVVCTHTDLGTQLTGGRLAVEAFFGISGFYVALVLSAGYRSVWLFYLNRYLRLMPGYLVIASLSLLSIVVFGVVPFPTLESSWLEASIGARFLLVVSNGFLLFQDWVMFTCSDHSGTWFVSDFKSCSPPLYTGLLVPQGWSLGVELSFYAVAPFLMRSANATVLSIALASILLKGGLAALGFHFDPWTYRFFPSELHLFLLGALCYRFRNSGYALFAVRDRNIATLFICCFAIIFSRLPYTGLLQYVFLASLLMLMPALMEFSTQNSWDRLLGELSYPLYVCHVLVISWMHHLDLGRGLLGGLLCLLMSLFACVILYRFVDSPMERIRRRVRVRALAT